MELAAASSEHRQPPFAVLSTDERPREAAKLVLGPHSWVSDAVRTGTLSRRRGRAGFHLPSA